MRWVALFKGVNVGGARKLPMADLRRFATDLGFADVNTLLASGNLLFTADEASGGALEVRLEHEVQRTLGLKTDILLRNARDLSRAIETNPFPAAARDHSHHLLVHFYREAFPTELIDQLARRYVGPERFAAIGRELYVDYPLDIGHSKLPQAMASVGFPKVVTARNWNTVLKLATQLC